MAEHDSKDNQPQDPWGKRPEQGPPDLIEVVKKFFTQGTKKNTGGKKPAAVERTSFYIWIVLGFIVLLWGLSGIFVVSPAQQSVILRFGKYVTTVGPGPHWIPRFVESRYTIDVQQVRNFNYKAEMLTQDDNPTLTHGKNNTATQEQDGIITTTTDNSNDTSSVSVSIVFVSLAIQYRIANPSNFLFNVVDPIVTLQQATSSAVRQAVGNMTLNAVLTKGRQKLRDAIEQQIKRIMKLYNTGIVITDVNLKPVQPPEAVTDAFNDVIKAREDKRRYANQANAYASKVVSIAKGQAASFVQSAKAYQQQVLLKAKGATARYLALLKPYQLAPVVTGERLYLDTVSSVLSRTTNIVVDSSGNNVFYLPLDQVLRKSLKASNKRVYSINAMTQVKTNKPTSGLSEINYGSSRPSYPTGEE